MGPLAVVLLTLAVLLGALVFWLGKRAGWHAVLAVGAAAVPVALVFFLGLIGMLISGLYVAAIYKLAA